MRNQVKHEKRNSISTCRHVLFFLICQHTNEDFFDDFPKISEHFPKISEDSSILGKCRGSLFYC